ncbi:MAG: J domain-containing protein [Cyanobacteria bacterium J06598_1]
MPASPSSQPPSSSSNAQGARYSKTITPPSDTDFYTLLGLAPGASVQAIRRAYRDLSKLYHPDTTDLESAIATVKFQMLNEAYATLSSPEKRLAYDYKIGYSRLSVMQPLSANAPKYTVGGKPYDPTDSAYLDPSDRPLSAGELFALFILGITFIGCLILVFTIGLTKSELPITQSSETQPPTDQTSIAQPIQNATEPSVTLSDTDDLIPFHPPLAFPSIPAPQIPSP